jgi:DNA primase catalytic core
VLGDADWPALVAAVSSACLTGWSPEQLLNTAYDLLRAGHPDDEQLRPDKLTTALVWRIGLLTDPTSGGRTTTCPAPDDLDQLPTPDAVLDEDWLAGLAEPEDLDDPGPPEDDPAGAADTGRAIGQAESGDAPRVDRRRLLELNEEAADFFAARFRDSWAPSYLIGRLGTDLAADERFTLGYAPAGWTELTDHLRRLGATDTEIVAAGLGSYASTGRVIDRFRDRLLFAIHDGAEIHGWIGRRNPAHDGDDAGRAVPKYLNTAETDLFTKGCELYGLTEGATALAAGAVPVIVEGPLDALAVTLAGDGDYVGVAPLGTAFTDVQADRLRPFIGEGGPGVIVATDADSAGQTAAQRIFWQLTACGDDPRHLAVATGKDPAELLQMAGATALLGALAASPRLAGTLIDARVAVYADRLDSVEGQVHATRRAAEVIAALPTTSWPAHLTELVARTGIAPDIALSEVFDAAQVRSEVDRRARAALPAEDGDANVHIPGCATESSPPVTGRQILTGSTRAAQLAASAALQSQPSGRRALRQRS